MKRNVDIWLDDVRQPPDKIDDLSKNEVIWLKSSHEAVTYFQNCMEDGIKIAFMSWDHDLGENDTAMRVADWMEEHQFFPTFSIIHSQNPVGRENLHRAFFSWYRNELI